MYGLADAAADFVKGMREEEERKRRLAQEEANRQWQEKVRRRREQEWGLSDEDRARRQAWEDWTREKARKEYEHELKRRPVLESRQDRQAAFEEAKRRREMASWKNEDFKRKYQEDALRMAQALRQFTMSNGTDTSALVEAYNQLDDNPDNDIVAVQRTPEGQYYVKFRNGMDTVFRDAKHIQDTIMYGMDPENYLKAHKAQPKGAWDQKTAEEEARRLIALKYGLNNDFDWEEERGQKALHELALTAAYMRQNPGVSPAIANERVSQMLNKKEEQKPFDPKVLVEQYKKRRKEKIEEKAKELSQEERKIIERSRENPIIIRTKAQFDQLPSGAYYIDAENPGYVYQKP